MANEDNIISSLEHSLRQFQATEKRQRERLREIEEEAQYLKVEIEALQSSAEKTAEALHALIPSMRNTGRKKNAEIQDEPKEYQNKPRYEDENHYDYEYQRKSRYEDENNYDYEYQRKPRYENEYETPSPRYRSQSRDNQPPLDYRNNQVSYMNNSKNIAPINRNYEAKSNRFADRTITQACTLILRELNSPLHVNDLYNLLVDGGFEFKGNNPTISIAVSLNRNRRFSKVAPGTFDLVMRDASKAAS